jgi:hypothetical protein
MDKITVLAIAAAILLVAGAVFAAADFLDEDVPDVPAAGAGGGGDAAGPSACSAGNDCGAGCGGQCGGSCGVPGCSCGR